MTYVVTEPCIKCKYTDCVTVCPVDCFHEDGLRIVIFIYDMVKVVYLYFYSRSYDY